MTLFLLLLLYRFEYSPVTAGSKETHTILREIPIHMDLCVSIPSLYLFGSAKIQQIPLAMITARVSHVLWPVRRWGSVENAWGKTRDRVHRAEEA